MRGIAVFTVFLAIFLASSLVISLPLFPGNMICVWLSLTDPNRATLMSALVNAVFYGFISWTVYSLCFKWIERVHSKSKAAKATK